MCINIKTDYPDGRTVLYKSICHEQLMAEAPAAPPTRSARMKRLAVVVVRKIVKAKAKTNTLSPHYTRNVSRVSVDSFISNELAAYAHVFQAEDCGCEACTYTGGGHWDLLRQ
ncbi:MAG: hypothetical protein M1815_006093 [Lichina confinis]|nr:MAG: hypothetical protein M1815_006093 [Lichina confinis]